MNKLKRRRDLHVAKPTSEEKYKIDGKLYLVTSHYIGERDIDDVLLSLAKNKAYSELG